MEKKNLKVGFDLDGVILYNPARIVRPILSAVKHLIFKKKGMSFYVPKTKTEQLMWYLVHKSSFIPAPGMRELKQALHDKKFTAYIITARYNSLQKDFKKWIEKIEAPKYFAGYFHNEKNEQPHMFKKRMIQKLNLDVFVDDNWDIVQYLRKEFEGTPVKIYWIYNLLDKHILSPNKFPHMKQVVIDILLNLEKKH